MYHWCTANADLPGDTVHYFADTAVKAATLAAQVLLKHFCKHHGAENSIDVLQQEARDLCAQFTSSDDHEANRIIIDVLHKSCPSHNILTKDTGLIDNNSAYTWIINALVGRDNFLNHNPFFSVSVCLSYDNEPITGVILSPFVEEMIVARRGHGCTLNGRPARVSSTRDLARTCIVGSPGAETDNKRFAEMEYSRHRQIKDFRMTGSAAVECYMVAAGRVDGFTLLNASLTDVAAGILAVQEAGGRATDFHGRAWSPNETGLLLSNGLVHDAIVEELQNDGLVCKEQTLAGFVGD